MKTSKQLLKTTLAILISIGVNVANAQTFEWARTFGGSSYDEGRSITVDALGNVYTTGSFQGTVDFDPGAGTANLTSVGLRDIFVQKLDATGNFLWARSFGGNSFDEGQSIAVDFSGNVYTTGYFQVTVDFDPSTGTFNLISEGSHDVFVQKLDSSGNFIWAKSLGSVVDDVGYSITLDASGNVYTTGYFYGFVDFDPGAGTANLTSAGLFDIFVQKLDASGNFLWARSIGSTANDVGLSIKVDASGNVYTTGYFNGAVDFDPDSGTANLTSVGSDDVFIQKLDSSGSFLWARSFGASSNDLGHSIKIDALGNVYTTGFFLGTVDFDPGVGTANLTPAGSGDIFVQKLDASGNFLWAKSFGGSSFDIGHSITVDSSGNAYTIGNFRGTLDFDPGAGTAYLTSVSVGQADVFVQKLDTSGNFLWARSFGGSDIDLGNSITVDASGNVYSIGSFAGTADFDPGAGAANLISAGFSDVFVHKMSQGGVTGLVGIAKGVQVKVFPNPSGGLIQLTFEQPMNDVEIRVTDLQGKTVFTKELDAVTDEQINIAGPSGTYFLSVKTPQGQTVVKLVKE
jgi:hypothetical protein